LILFGILLMTIIFVNMAKSYKRQSIPSGMGRLLEPIVIYIRDEIARPNIGERHYKRYMSFLNQSF